jgi:hypothetical protein
MSIRFSLKTGCGSRSSFAVVVSCLCIDEDLPPLSAMLMRAVSGRSRLMRDGFHTRTHRCRSSDEGHSLLGQRVCAYHDRQNTSALTLSYPFEAAFVASFFVNSNTWHLICNNFNLNFIYGILCLYVLCLRILTSSRIPRYDLGRQTPHS